MTGRGAAPASSSPSASDDGGIPLDRAPYLEALEAHVASQPVRLLVPGHKGHAFRDHRLGGLLGSAFELDIPPLVDGVDAGPEPTPYELAQRLAARAWKARRTWFVVNGASHANHAACIALASRGRTVIVQRNVHSSVIDALVVTGLLPCFVAPEVDAGLGIAHCVTPAALRRALAGATDVAGIIVTSPTYFGTCADVAGLAEIAHDHGVPLVVDEAWGAHFAFHERLPADALSAGADLVVSSTHKMLGSLTQSAMLHLGERSMVDEDAVERGVRLLESTSRSALLGCSLDAARQRASVHGHALAESTMRAMPEIHDRIRALPGLDVLDERMVGRHGIVDVDPFHVAITLENASLDGGAVARVARRRGNVFFELVTPRVLVAVLGLGETGQGIDALIEAIEPEFTLSGVPAARADESAMALPPGGRLAISPREAFLAANERVPLAQAAGEIAAETLAVYPPGIPAVVAGEELSPGTVEYLQWAAARGSTIRGFSDPTGASVLVVRTSHRRRLAAAA